MRTTAIVKRSFESLRDNWILSLIMTIEIIFLTLLALLPVSPLIARIIDGPADPLAIIETIEQWFATILESPLTIFTIFATLLAVVLIALLIHVFVVGGVTRLLHDWESIKKSESDTAQPPPFTFARWLAACRKMFFPTFLLYNIIWGLGLLAGLAPALPLIAFIAIEEDPNRLAVIGVSGLALWILFLIALSVIIRSVNAVALGRLCHDPENVLGSIHGALTTAASRLPSFLALTAVMFLIGVVAGVVSGTLNVGNGHPSDLAPLVLTFEALKWLFNALLSAIAGVWLLAAFITFEHDQTAALPSGGKAFATT